MTVAYDGTAFHGWQRQPDQRTAQGVLEQALSAVLESPVQVNGAGRTDAGVHARGQVASFSARTPLPARAIASLAARALPSDLRIVEASEATEGFHARHSAIARRYRYHLLDAPDLLQERFAWWPRRPWRLADLQRASEPLVGRQDHSSFESQGSSPAEPVCRITRARWTATEGGAAFEVRADHFLYRMVRNLVGTQLVAAATDDPAGHMRTVLAARDRRAAGPSAEPQGLSLEAVDYTALPEDQS